MNEKESRALRVHDDPAVVETPILIAKMCREAGELRRTIVRPAVDKEIAMGGPHHSQWCIFPDVEDEPQILQIEAVQSKAGYKLGQ